MKQILQNTIQNWWSTPLPTIKQREIDLTRFFDPNIKKILSVIGFRRVGKTFTMLDFAQKYGKEKCIYVNFEDERLERSTSTLTKLAEVITELKGHQPLVLLLDEIQEIPDWSLWARRMNETTPHHLILSGSSSKLSSREIPTEMRGQGISIQVFPLSWSEFLQFRNADIDRLPDTLRYNLLRDYLKYGGLPEVVLAEEGLRPLILTNYFTTFVQRDLVERYKLRKYEALSDLLRMLPNTRSFTYSKLANSLNSFGHKISKGTVIRYLQWLEWSFFLSKVELFSFNTKQRLQNPHKAYLIDNYFSSQYSSQAQEILGHLMEQVVWQKLHNQLVTNPIMEVNYWKDDAGYEIDFVLSEHKQVKNLIQVTYAQEQHEINDREIRSLVRGTKKLNCTDCTLITWSIHKQILSSGVEIQCIPLEKWLSTKSHTL